MAWEGRFHEVQENGCRFLVNLTDYLDTGLFLDHRLIRDLIRSLAAGRRFLNLFAYTGTGTVHAAAGGASTTTTVDLSHTFLAWARSNLVLNGFAGNRHEFLQADCLTWLAGQRRRYDLILLDPPTFSNSKRMRGSFDVQRDHVALIRAVADLLARNGILIFSTHCRRFRLDTETLGDLQCEDLSQTTLPRDFARNPRIHQCWKITQR
jgi:23S rRNA (guanine2445-N2)-methyltransferase / 23S rRNA (guanine2069-N7)-methyltransferase